MSKKKTKKRNKRYQPPSTPLHEHQKTGRTLLQTPVMATGRVSLTDWFRDGLPDYLWAAILIEGADDIDAGVSLVLGILRHIDAALGIDPDVVRDIPPIERTTPWLDGSLCRFESLDDSQRTAVLDGFTSTKPYDAVIPERCFHALGMYPGFPGEWLLEPWRKRGLSVDPATAERTLAKVAELASSGRGELATAVKVVWYVRTVEFGRILFGPGTIDVDMMVRYPHDTTEDERKQLEASMRATFQSKSMMDDEGEDAPIAWAEKFWRANGHMFRCRTAEISEGPATVEQRDAADMVDVRSTLVSEIEKVADRFQDACVKANPDIYDPARFEVLSGMTFRSIRYAKNLAELPPLWASHLGLILVRVLLEALIDIRWLRDVARGDVAVYERFQSHGRGKLKLYTTHWADLLTKHDDPPEDLERFVEALVAEVNQDTMEMFQDIDFGTFEKTSYRDRAHRVGMEDEYRLHYSLASAAMHGEWHMLDRYFLTRCLNPLHRYHRTPDFDESEFWTLGIVEMAIDLASQACDEFESEFPASLI